MTLLAIDGGNHDAADNGNANCGDGRVDGIVIGIVLLVVAVRTAIGLGLVVLALVVVRLGLVAIGVLVLCGAAIVRGGTVSGSVLRCQRGDISVGRVRIGVLVIIGSRVGDVRGTRRVRGDRLDGGMTLCRTAVILDMTCLRSIGRPRSAIATRAVTMGVA